MPEFADSHPAHGLIADSGLGTESLRAVSVPLVRTTAAKLLSAPRVFTCCVHPQEEPSPGRGGLRAGAVPRAMLRHYIYAGAVQGFKKTHSKCKHFCTYSHWTSTHEVFCCFLHKSRVKELHKEHSSRCLEHWGSLTARQHATRQTLSSRNIVSLSPGRFLLPTFLI